MQHVQKRVEGFSSAVRELHSAVEQVLHMSEGDVVQAETLPFNETEAFESVSLTDDENAKDLTDGSLRKAAQSSGCDVTTCVR